MTHSTNEKIFDAELAPHIVGNNAQYRKRFHVANYREFKLSFLAGSNAVVPEYPFLQDTRLVEKRANLSSLAKNIVPQSGVDPLVQELYQAKIREKETLLSLVESAAIAQENTLVGRTAAERFNELSAVAFGVPSQNVFNQLVSRIKSDIALIPLSNQQSNAFKRMRVLLDGEFPTTISPFVPFVQPFDDSEPVTDAAVVVAFLRAKLAELGLSDWKVKITPKPIGGFRVYVNKKLIRVPHSSVLRSRKNNRTLTRSVMEGIFAHEILTHVVRYANGISSPLMLLAYGLAQYLPGEEGIATYREQRCNGATDYSGGTMYFAIGLAYGLDRGGVHRTFSEVFAILCDYFTLRNHGGVRATRSKAFATCCRIFVMSPHADMPMILTRDSAYREGNIAIIDLLARNPSAEQAFDIGKYDPTNTGHTEALKALGIL